MLFKLPIRNMRRSIRDYAIYFFTLIIGVSVFYVFNSISGQAAMMEVSRSRNDIVELLGTTISGVSVFVAVILALLIVYASRFLMKRRNREFALYMLLGMSKGKISAILLVETILIGIGSLVVGIGVGIGLSQLMSALVVNLFEADMSAFRFTISGKSIVMTIIYFAIMYLVVMIFNSTTVTRMKLINLIQSGKKSERIRLKNPILCVIIFIASAAVLGYAYYEVGWNYGELNQRKMALMIGMGALSTFFIFWSVSGLFLRIIMSMKNVYHRGLNAFTFRQLSSKVNTMVFSMTVICLMLFVTICALTAAFSIRNSLNSNIKELCPADAEINFAADEMGISEIYADCGYDITDGFKEYSEITIYGDPSFILAASLGSHLESIRANYRFLDYESPEEIVKLSEYNKLMELYGKETLEMEDDEFILICDFKSMKAVRDEALDTGSEITVFGKTLHSKYSECRDGFISISAQHVNIGVFIVPDEIVPEDCAKEYRFIGNYDGTTKEELEAVESVQRERFNAVYQGFGTVREGAVYDGSINTKLDIFEAAVGLGAILAFLGLYIGLVFLIACGAILALKELSESVDSLPRYEMLRKIGAEERDINISLFRQTGVFFLLPLVLAIVHSVFGMKFATQVMEVFGTDGIKESIILTSIILLVIYGGYFLVTFYNSRWIIKGRELA
ncbi:MAG: ABC transporter permease [Lachnospiraceae bacterium]|nr:ABC transporter permease [Lachnospiraceae bacterium]